MNSTWRWLSGSLATGSSHTFTDIAGNPHAASIAALHHHGVINGRTDTSYAPASPVTRGQMGSFLARLMTMHGDAGYLPGTAASSTTTTTRPPTTTTTRPADGLTRDTAAETVIFNQHNQARAAAGPTGKASGRDRVGQYVQMSGVALPINKTHN